MAIYFISVLGCLWGSLLKNRIPKYYILFFLLLFICCGYMTGTDWRNYEESYNTARFDTLLDERFELGYGVLQTICHELSIDFWTFHIIIKAIVFYLLSRMISFLEVNLLMFWAFFLPEMGFFLFKDCPFRNLIALGFFCLAFPALLERRAKAFFYITVVAVLFHYSALILVPIYFLVKYPLKNKYYIILFILSNILAYKVDYILGTIFASLFDLSDFLRERLVVYVLDDKFHANTINIGTIYRALFFVLFLCFRTKFESEMKYGKLLFALSMFFFIVYPFTISIKIFSRFNIYMLPIYLATILMLLKTIRSVSLRYAIFSILLVWTMLKTYTVITEDYRYVPYSSYLEYLFQDKPSYIYRSGYNIQKSPYGTGEN